MSDVAAAYDRNDIQLILKPVSAPDPQGRNWVLQIRKDLPSQNGDYETVFSSIGLVTSEQAEDIVIAARHAQVIFDVGVNLFDDTDTALTKLGVNTSRFKGLT